jgi:excisionase family DNA binding protein
VSPTRTQPTGGRRYATLAEAAEYLRCNERTIRRKIAAGQLRAYHSGRKLIRIDLNELDEQLMRPIPTVKAQ